VVTLRVTKLHSDSALSTIGVVTGNTQLLRSLALLCVVALLLAVGVPAGSGLLLAVLVPLGFLVVANVCRVLSAGEISAAPRPVFLRPAIGRAPPLA
jgi:uncharacterized protein (DUF58 family)